jgi:hypothetical protein
MPLKEFHLYAQKLSLTAADKDKVYEFDYTCPCGSSYSPTTLATDPDATSGKISVSGTKSKVSSSKKDSGSGLSTSGTHESQGGKLKRATAEGNCKVKIPSVSQLSSYTSGCTSIMAVVLTTKNMCPNSEISTTDSQAFQAPGATDGTDSLLSVSSSTTDAYADSSSSSSTCKTSEYKQMACTGSNIEVSFYCAKADTTDSSNKLTVNRLQVTKISNGGSIEYSMN